MKDNCNNCQNNRAGRCKMTGLVIEQPRKCYWYKIIRRRLNICRNAAKQKQLIQMD